MPDRRPPCTDDVLLETSKIQLESFATLVQRNDGQFSDYFRRRLGHDQIDDALAELWETAFRRRHAFDDGRGSAVGWLHGIAHNVVRHTWRTAQRSRHLVDRLELLSGPGVDVDPADALSERELARTVWTSLGALPDHEREVVELVVVREWSYELTARELGIPIGTVRSRLSRARSRMRNGAAAKA